MNDHPANHAELLDPADHDEYLWTGQGPVSLEIAAIERRLRPIAWRPGESSELGAISTGVAPEPTVRVQPKPRFNPGRARPWVAPALAGLAAAAAVLGLLWLAGPDPHTTEIRAQEPQIDPAGRPSPDLKDPFARDGAPLAYPAPSPATGPVRPVSPDLVDPFGTSTRPPISPDLNDPFADGESAPSGSPDLANPFAERNNSGTSCPTRRVSPDLKDPFGKQLVDDPCDTPADSGRVSPHLKDPFGKKGDPDSQVSPNLEDPFGTSGDSDQRISPDFKDPFGKKGDPQQVSPNLEDPFKR